MCSNCASVLLIRRQLAVEQEIADLQKRSVLGEILDGVAAVQQNAFLAVDEGDVATRLPVEVKPGS